MFIIMKKRGLGKKADVSHHIYFIMFEVVLVVLLAAALFSFVESIRKSTVFEKNYLSKDAALTASTLQFSPESVEYTYSSKKLDLRKFIFSFANNRAAVSENPEFFDEQPLVVYYPFSSDSSTSLEISSLAGSSFVNFAVSASNSIIRDSLGSTPFKSYRHIMQCPDIGTQDSDWRSKKILIDPVGGVKINPVTKEKEFQGLSYPGDQSFNEDSVVLQISNALSHLHSFEATRDDESWISLEDRWAMIDEETGAVLVLKIGLSNSLRAFVPYGSSHTPESSKLACLIINSLLSNSELNSIRPFDSASIVQVNVPLIMPFLNEKLVLGHGEVVVVLELGSILLGRENNFLTRSSAIAHSIYNAFEEYYE